jgi:hypothetical protein
MVGLVRGHVFQQSPERLVKSTTALPGRRAGGRHAERACYFSKRTNDQSPRDPKRYSSALLIARIVRAVYTVVASELDKWYRAGPIGDGRGLAPISPRRGLAPIGKRDSANRRGVGWPQSAHQSAQIGVDGKSRPH